MSGEATGCVTILVGAVFVSVWIGGCAITISNEATARDKIYKEIWKAAPDLERAHGKLSTELARLHSIREDLKNRKRLFKSEEAQQEADKNIAAVDGQISRLEAQRRSIISAVERQSLTNISVKVENPMQQEMIEKLESDTIDVVGDAETVRRSIESVGFSEPHPLPDKDKHPSPPSRNSGNGAPPARQEAPQQFGVSGDKSSLSTAPNQRLEVPESARHLFQPRIWNDRYGHRISARLLKVEDPWGNTVATLGIAPDQILAKKWIVNLQREDGGVIRIPISKFSDRDLVFFSNGR